MAKIRKFGFDVVHGCQLRCVGCPNSTLKPKISWLTPEFFSKCLSNLDVDEVSQLRLFVYGEPMLHPDLPEVIAQIPKQKFKTRRIDISTNAQCKITDTLEKIIRQKIVTHFGISCDGDGTPEDYERLRSPSKWNRMIEWLETVSNLRKLYNPKLKLLTRTICTKRTGQKRWKKILKPYGFEPHFRHMRRDPQSVYAATKKIKMAKGACDFVKKSYFYADADGTVIPCCVHPRAVVLGDLSKQTYSEICATTRKAFAKKMAKQRKIIPICNKCEILC